MPITAAFNLVASTRMSSGRQQQVWLPKQSGPVAARKGPKAARSSMTETDGDQS
jgi:hypothetical protein